MNGSGYEILEGAIAPGECANLLDEMAWPARGTARAGSRHLMAHPTVARFARRPALVEIARRWVGRGAVPYRATLFEKSAVRNWLVVWHQDTALPLASRLESAEWGPWSVKEGILYAHAPSWALSRIVALRIHLDASTRDNGPLRVIPGSHAEGVLADPDVLRVAHGRPAVDCVAGRGSVLAMSPMLIHSSSKALRPEPRRVLHLEYAASLTLSAGVCVAVA